MGNCAAPPLAIIYMHHVETAIRQKCPEIIFWKRYIDDIFFIIRHLSPESLLATANSVNRFITFTLEEPENDSLPYLDVLVTKENHDFSFKLFTKPLHSGCCLPFDAFVPNSRKKCLITSEVKRARRNTSNPNKADSEHIIKERLQRNGYPPQFINRTIENIRETTEPRPNFTSFVKVPFISNRQRRQVPRLLRQTGMHEEVRVVFTTERPLSRQFRPRFKPMTCPATCATCLTARKPGMCYTKNAIYEITCDICGDTYIGQTKRTMRSRINEHTKSKESLVFQHMSIHGTSTSARFRWRVITTEACTTTRLSIEALQIAQQTTRGRLMNGCSGTATLPCLR